MPKYKVLKKGFFGGVLREPGGKHDPVITSKPFPKNETPSWLKLMTKADESRAAKAAEVTVPNEGVEDFMGDDDPDVETM